MAENTPNNLQNEREAAVQEWEKETNRPVVADDRKKQMTGVAIGLMAVFAIGAVWYIKNGQGSSTQMAANSELTIPERRDRKSTRLNSSHVAISYAVFYLKK